MYMYKARKAPVNAPNLDCIGAYLFYPKLFSKKRKKERNGKNYVGITEPG